MKELSARAAGTTQASPEQVFAVLTDYESYPSWYPSAVRGAEILERDPESGDPTKVKVTLYASVGPLNREFRLWLAVTKDPFTTVELARIPKDPNDREEMEVTWAIAADGSGSMLSVDLRARLNLPPLLPTGGVPERFAKGFLAAALDALK